MTVRLPRNSKSGPEAMGALLVNGSGGLRIPLSQVARIKLQTGESTISHEMNERQITVRVDNRDRDLASYLEEARSRIAREIKIDPAQFRLQWAGQFENQQRAQARLLLSLAIVVALMSVLLFFQFGKVRLVTAAWRRAWDRVIPFFAFPPAVRRVVYTTNAIESVHSRLRKIIKTRGHFPSDDAASKLIWLALRNITADWGRAAKEWRDAMNQFAILYEERFTHPNHGSARTGG